MKTLKWQSIKVFSGNVCAPVAREIHWAFRYQRLYSRTSKSLSLIELNGINIVMNFIFVDFIDVLTPANL